jgi:hypothetical protein
MRIPFIGFTGLERAIGLQVITFVFLGCYRLLLLADPNETGSGGAAAKRRGWEVPRQRGPTGTIQDTWFLKNRFINCALRVSILECTLNWQNGKGMCFCYLSCHLLDKSLH